MHIGELLPCFANVLFATTAQHLTRSIQIIQLEQKMCGVLRLVWTLQKLTNHHVGLIFAKSNAVQSYIIHINLFTPKVKLSIRARISHKDYANVWIGEFLCCANALFTTIAQNLTQSTQSIQIIHLEQKICGALHLMWTLEKLTNRKQGKHNRDSRFITRVYYSPSQTHFYLQLFALPFFAKKQNKWT